MDVRYVAELARLELTEAEIAKYQDQLDRIVEYLEKLDSCDLSGVDVEVHAGAALQPLREDEPGECLDCGTALANAPATAGDQFRVPKVVE
jgi:aspartyl-tRNA(Asn)/glutamyl-tRNA(Gln) amidotransferase subunit C